MVKNPLPLPDLDLGPSEPFRLLQETTPDHEQRARQAAQLERDRRRSEQNQTSFLQD